MPGVAVHCSDPSVGGVGYNSYRVQTNYFYITAVAEFPATLG